MTKWHIKLNADDIVGHVDDAHPGFNPADYDAIVSVDSLVDNSGNYAYKYVTGNLVALTAQEIDDHPTKTLNTTDQIRIDRTKLLYDCDWTQGSDSPLSAGDQTLWATYRQELRDFPANVIDIYNPIWPTEPA